MNRKNIVSIGLSLLLVAGSVAVVAANDDNEQQEAGGFGHGIGNIVKPFERAIDRLEKFGENGFGFRKDLFEHGAAPATLMIGPEGQARITRANVADVSGDVMKIEIWKLIFSVHNMPDTKVLGGGGGTMQFSDVKAGDVVNVLGKLDADQAAFIHAEVIHDFTQLARERDAHIAELQAKINELIKRLQDLLSNIGAGTSTPPIVAKGTVTGQVLLGPTCAVERVPPDPLCADKPYQTTIQVQSINPSAPYTTISTDASGAFSVSLDPGTYIFTPQGGASRFPICSAAQVVVFAGQTQTIKLHCDTGIR